MEEAAVRTAQSASQGIERNDVYMGGEFFCQEESLQWQRLRALSLQCYYTKKNLCREINSDEDNIEKTRNPLDAEQALALVQ